jgi:hypothetical protein
MDGEAALQVFPAEGKCETRRLRAYANRQNYSTHHRQSVDSGELSRRNNLTVWPRFHIPSTEGKVGGSVGPGEHLRLSHFSTPSACCRWKGFEQGEAMIRNRKGQFRCARCSKLLCVVEDCCIDVKYKEFKADFIGGMIGNITCWRCGHLNVVRPPGSQPSPIPPPESATP